MNFDPLKNLKFEQTTGVICEKCNGSFFSEGLLIRRVSKFLVANDSSKDTIIPVPVMYCISCKHVNEEFLPEPLKNMASE
jgi:hypothetical protein